MKAMYFWVFSLFFSSLILSYYILPSEEQIALIEWRGGKFGPAKKYYMQQYSRGYRSPSVLIALSQIGEHEGNVEMAIEKIQELLEQYPNDFFLLKQLANLFVANQQYDNYFQVLLKLQSLYVNPEVLQDLASWYKDANDSEKLFSTLIQLAEMGKGEASNYTDLALFYAKKKEYQKAFDTMEIVREQFPKELSVNDVLFEVWVMDHLESKKGEPQVELLSQFLLQKNDPKVAVYALQVFFDRNPSSAPVLIDRIRAKFEKDPYFQTVALSILWDQRVDRERTSDEIIAFYAQLNHSNAQLENMLFTIYLDRACDECLLKLNLERINRAQIIDFCIAAILQKKEILAKKVEKALGFEYLKSHPVIKISLSIASDEPCAVKKLDQWLETGWMTLSDRVSLLKVTAAANLFEEATQIGCQLYPYTGLTESQLFDVAHSYLTLKMGDDLYEMIERALPTSGGPILAFLDVSLNRSMRAAEWLHAQKEIKESVLVELYSAAEEKKDYPFALIAAKKRVSLYPSNTAMADYGLALVQVGKIETGLAILKQSRIDDAYFQGLRYAVKHDPAYRSTLVSYMQKTPKSHSLLREYAYAYQEDLHDFDQAEKIFWTLSENASPHSDDVQALIYLWGPRVQSEKKIDWLIQKALTADPDQFNGWLEHLVFIGQTDEVATLSENRGNVNSFAYMQALLQREKIEALASAIWTFLPYVQHYSELEKLASYASLINSLSLQEAVWERGITLYPDDPRVLRQYANIEFNRHHYTASKCALEKLGVDESDSYEIHYEYGQILRSERQFIRGNQYLRRALCEIDQLIEPDPQALITRSQICWTLRIQKQNTYDDLQGLYNQSIGDPTMTSDYVNMLMNMGCLEMVEEILDGRCE